LAIDTCKQVKACYALAECKDDDVFKTKKENISTSLEGVSANCMKYMHWSEQYSASTKEISTQIGIDSGFN
jgi:hypothetical protein